MMGTAMTTTKRANFDLSPEQEELLANLRAQLAASSTKEAVLRAVQLTTLLLDEVSQGNRLFVGRSATTAIRLAIPELETRAHGQWRWLVERPHPWRRQLWIKGRKLLASAVWLDALSNGMGPREAAENWDQRFTPIADRPRPQPGAKDTVAGPRSNF
jgi:hypothetical protein